MAKLQCDVEVLIRGAHEQIISGLMELNVDQLRMGLTWSRSEYSKLDIERLLEMAIELHEK